MKSDNEDTKEYYIYELNFDTNDIEPFLTIVSKDDAEEICEQFNRDNKRSLFFYNELKNNKETT